MIEREPSVARVVRALAAGTVRPVNDRIVTEEPLEIRLLTSAGQERTVAVTMRTPGHDFELAAGFLCSEGIVRAGSDVERLEHATLLGGVGDEPTNVVRVVLAGSDSPDLGGLERHFFASSACGVCGKAGLEQLTLRGCAPLPEGPVVAADVLHRLPSALAGAQTIFAATGGLHAAGVFDTAGNLVAAREDVGRHNALDKVVGWAMLSGRPLAGSIVLVSGRASFEIVQKCLVARVPILCAVSAPTSLAVQTAESFGMTLVGFLGAERMNIYCGAERIGG